MTAKILSFPEGKHLPNLTKQQKQTVDEKIANEQTRKYANAVADEIVIGSFGKVGNIFTISARIVDAESGEVMQAISYDSDYSIENLLKFGMRDCAYRLMGKNPPVIREFNIKNQVIRLSLGYSLYLIVLGILPPA